MRDAVQILCGHLCGHSRIGTQAKTYNLLKEVVGAAGLEPATSCV
jgi:hypothetical protein